MSSGPDSDGFPRLNSADSFLARRTSYQTSHNTSPPTFCWRASPVTHHTFTGAEDRDSQAIQDRSQIACTGVDPASGLTDTFYVANYFFTARSRILNQFCSWPTGSPSSAFQSHMKPSRLSTSATPLLTLEIGISTLGRSTLTALRMRVSNVGNWVSHHSRLFPLTLPLPTCLAKTRDNSLVSKVAKADSTHAKFAINRTGGGHTIYTVAHGEPGISVETL